MHRDVKIRDYLNAEKQENMNLMFYDFNGSSMHTAQKTAQNFFKPGAQCEGVVTGSNDVEAFGQEGQTFQGNGDRVPTRSRGYRSAHQNFRRKNVMRGQMNIGDMVPPGNEHLMPPSGL